jgi:hypothetical protein
MIHLPLSPTFPYLLALEPFRAMCDYMAGHIQFRDLTQKGDGHPVLVLPGLGASGAATADMRVRLQQLGYAVYDWKHGMNYGPGIDFNLWLRLLGDHLKEIAETRESLVSVIGWSFGGTYARELAKVQPHLVRQVITLATPFAPSGTASAELGSAVPMALLPDPELQKRLSKAPPVPSTSIYSQTDGIVNWKQCMAPESSRHRNIEVEGVSHLGMVHHPAVLSVLAKVLQDVENKRVRAR